MDCTGCRLAKSSRTYCNEFHSDHHDCPCSICIVKMMCVTGDCSLWLDWFDKHYSNMMKNTQKDKIK